MKSGATATKEAIEKLRDSAFQARDWPAHLAGGDVGVVAIGTAEYLFKEALDATPASDEWSETLTRGEVKHWIQHFPLNSAFSDEDGSLKGALALKEQLAHNIQAAPASTDRLKRNLEARALAFRKLAKSEIDGEIKGAGFQEAKMHLVMAHTLEKVISDFDALSSSDEKAEAGKA